MSRCAMRLYAVCAGCRAPIRAYPDVDRSGGNWQPVSSSTMRNDAAARWIVPERIVERCVMERRFRRAAMRSLNGRLWFVQFRLRSRRQSSQLCGCRALPTSLTICRTGAIALADGRLSSGFIGSNSRRASAFIWASVLYNGWTARLSQELVGIFRKTVPTDGDWLKYLLIGCADVLLFSAAKCMISFLMSNRSSEWRPKPHH